MSVNTIYPEEPCLIPISFTENPLSAYNKDNSDIEDALICEKKKVGEPENKYLVKYYKDGNGGGSPTGDVLIDESTHTFTLNKLETDNLAEYDKGYRFFIGLKLTGLSRWIWLRVDPRDLLIVEADGISV